MFQASVVPAGFPTRLTGIAVAQRACMDQHVRNCMWAVPTLLMPRPYWLEAADAPWSCWTEGHVSVLQTTDVCGNCPKWRQRTAVHVAVPPEGAEPACLDL